MIRRGRSSAATNSSSVAAPVKVPSDAYSDMNSCVPVAVRLWTAIGKPRRAMLRARFSPITASPVTPIWLIAQDPTAVLLSGSTPCGRPDYYGNPAGLTDEAEIVRAIYDAFARRDVDALLRHLARTASSTYAAPPGSPVARPYRGHDGVREYFADVAQQWEDLVLHAEDFRIIPGSVIVIGHVTGRRDGLDVRRSSVWTWRVANGRATSVKAADLGER